MNSTNYTEQQKQYELKYTEKEIKVKTLNKEIKKFNGSNKRLKMQGKPENEWKPRTRKICEEQRRKWRERKRIQRAHMSRHKKTAINAKRRKAYKEKKCETSLVSLTSVSAIKSEIQSEEKSSKFRVAKSRQRQKIASCLSSMQV